MKVYKKSAIDLLDEKISEFDAILSSISVTNLYDNQYKEAFLSAEKLLEEIFNKRESVNFREYTTNLSSELVTVPLLEAELKLYTEHIKRCIKKLEICKENFYLHSFNDFSDIFKDHMKLFYLSSNIENKHFEITDHISEILRTLRFEFNKGNKLNDALDLEYIKEDINDSEFFICVIGKKSGSLSNRFYISKQLETEIELAKQSRKTIIAWIEQGVTGVGEIFDAAEIIPFQFENLDSLKKTTILFLEILKKYKVI